VTEPSVKKPNALMAWMYRLIPKLPKSFRSDRMIILHHTGRRSHQPRVSGLDKVSYDADTDRYFVVAAYGPTSDWWLNVIADPNVSIEIDGRTVKAEASPVDHDEAVTIMTNVTQDNPNLRNRVCKHANVNSDDPEAMSKVVAVNPLMAFQVVHTDNT